MNCVKSVVFQKPYNIGFDASQFPENYLTLDLSQITYPKNPIILDMSQVGVYEKQYNT